jgi:hypothetical protein
VVRKRAFVRQGVKFCADDRFRRKACMRDPHRKRVQTTAPDPKAVTRRVGRWPEGTAATVAKRTVEVIEHNAAQPSAQYLLVPLGFECK